MNKTELKAAAYDCLSQIQFLEKQLQQINQAIANEAKKEVVQAAPAEEAKAE